MKNFVFTIIAALAIVCAAPVLADGLPQPTQEPILIVTGKIGATNGEGEARFDRPMLEALGMATIATKTPWYDGISTFEGVPLTALMETVKAEGETVTATALNDYITSIPMEDFAAHQPILALKRDGKYMSVRDKGPLFIVYPYDSNPDLQTQIYFARSAWQVARLNIE